MKLEDAREMLMTMTTTTDGRIMDVLIMLIEEVQTLQSQISELENSPILQRALDGLVTLMGVADEAPEIPDEDAIADEATRTGYINFWQPRS